MKATIFFSFTMCILITSNHAFSQENARNKVIIEKNLSVSKIPLKLFITENYNNPKYKNKCFKSITMNLLEGAGIVLDSLNYEYILAIDLNVYALYELYSGVKLYTGAQMNCSIKLYHKSDIKDSLKYTISCEKTRLGDGFVMHSGDISDDFRKDPAEAPYNEAITKSDYFKNLAILIKSVFNNDVYINYWIGAIGKTCDGENDLTIAAYEALGDTKDKRVVKPLMDKFFIMLGDEYAICEALAKIGSPSVESLIFVLNLPDNPDKFYLNKEKNMAAEALGKIKDERAKNVLLKTFQSKDTELNLWSAIALYKLGDTTKIDFIISGIKNTNIDYIAIKALEESNDKRFVDPLINVLIEEKYAIRWQDNIFSILQNLTGQKFNSKDKWIQWWQATKLN